MAEIKLTKNELRAQQGRLQQLKKYLPTLQLKKAMLQAEVAEASIEIAKCETDYTQVREEVDRYSSLLTEQLSVDIRDSAKIVKVHKRYENIAGVEVPYFENIVFADFSYNLFDTPFWLDSASLGLRNLANAQVKVEIAREKKAALEKEWREVSIRVNLFEKRLIPQAVLNIKKIKVFLGDQLLAAVSQAKVAKNKIEEALRLKKADKNYAI